MKAWLIWPLLLGSGIALAGESAQPDPAYPFRTDFANPQLPWYQLQPGEFPPRHAEHRVGGELVAADFVHRAGLFRTSGSGELVDFRLLPYGSVVYRGAEADLRDVPLGTYFEFSLFQDPVGKFTQVATMRDKFSLLAADGQTYRVDELQLDRGKLAVSRHAAPGNEAGEQRSELLVGAQTRVWKADRPAQLSDLAVGDELLVNLTDTVRDRGGSCSEIWIGAESQRLATERQRAAHKAFLKARGLPARIESVVGNQVTVTLFGEPADLQALCKDEGIVPQQYADEKRHIDVAVANDELRTYNPPADTQRFLVQKFDSVSTQSYGPGGIRWVMQPNELLLEGFRRGRIVRLFAHPGWPINDMPVGERLYEARSTVKFCEEETFQFPYRTDFGNQQLNWYRLQPGVFPPLRSQHLVSGELLQVDSDQRTGQFREDGTGELVNFSLPPFASISYLDAPADLSDLPLGTNFLFFLYQDDRGAFTRAAVILDEYSRLARDQQSYRVEGLRLAGGKIALAGQLALVRNEKDALVRPPDVGRTEFLVDDQTRVWKGDRQIKLADLAEGDELLVNLDGQSATRRSRCTDIWVGAETQQQVTRQRRAQYDARLKERGFAGWIERVAGQELTIAFFHGPSGELQTLLHDGPLDRAVSITLLDDQLHEQGSAVVAAKFNYCQLDGAHRGTYGCRGTLWMLGAEKPLDGIHPGQAVRVQVKR